MALPAFMQFALEEARAAEGRGEVPVGCVIVRDGEVIARAGNRTLADKDPTAHAELLAVRQAAATLELGAPCRLRSLCDAGALHDVRRGSVVRPYPPALFRRERSEGRGGGAWRAVFFVADLPPPARGLWRHQRKRMCWIAEGVFPGATINDFACGRQKNVALAKSFYRRIFPCRAAAGPARPVRRRRFHSPTDAAAAWAVVRPAP